MKPLPPVIRMRWPCTFPAVEAGAFLLWFTFILLLGSPLRHCHARGNVVGLAAMADSDLHERCTRAFTAPTSGDQRRRVKAVVWQFRTAAEQPPRATEAHATLQNNPQEHSHRQRTVHVLCQSRGEAALSAVLVNRTATRPRLRLRGAGARRVLVGIGVANPKGRNEFAGSRL